MRPLPGRSVVLVASSGVLFALLAWAVAAHGGGPLGPDRALHRWTVGHRPQPLTSVALLLTATGSGPVPYVAAMLAGWTGCGRPASPRKEATVAVAAVALLLAGQAVRVAVMTAVGRPRPPAADWAAVAGGSSFPSGHTTTAALAAGLLAWSAVRNSAPRTATRTFVGLCALWAVLIGCTRVYLGVHWPTDVLGGWLLATAWLALTLPVLGLVADRHIRPPGRGPGAASPADREARR
ncbi:phosphatase PAP2 family protein [Streptomyces sp. V4-01]|uniref:Phosphatase PAP2 family protein n=1 Tax=Actinacidiphila polyblastidii TaxID=3110430 RepID=A0ABU7PIS5_9ACTN|nr:phosphatase PAP2 family protein [Streptomyces sp. V4-01]